MPDINVFQSKLLHCHVITSKGKHNKIRSMRDEKCYQVRREAKGEGNSSPAINSIKGW